MAPVTRRSQAGGVAKKVTRKQRAPAARTTSDSWDFINTDNDTVRESVEVDHGDQLAIDGLADMDEAINPLRNMADKVGREVEEFAVTLDRFLEELHMKQNKYAAAKEVVLQFKDFADYTVEALQKSHQKERTEQLRKEWSDRAQLSTTTNGAWKSSLTRSGFMSEMKEEKVKELRHWQQESDIWQLFWFILDFWYDRDVRRKDAADTLANLALPHRYTPEKDIWERFLLENETAKERLLVKRWLEQAADHQESDLPSIMEELEKRSGTGKGLWNRGWLNTREKIKGEKRVRSWPSPSDSVQPQIRSSAGDDMLVTTLDPDAPSRQQHALEKPDAFFEKAMWIACWEMLRRGKPWEEIMRWCEDHSEGWRAVVLRPDAGATDALSNAAWRKMCYLASESGCSNDYEAAVYGLLSGNFKAVQKVCKTVDDHIFAYYSCLLVQQFDRYLEERHPDRISSLAVRQPVVAEAFHDKDGAHEALEQLIKQLRKDQAGTHGEAFQPLKIIESFLLTDETETLAFTVGTAISDLDSLHEDSDGVVARVRPLPPDDQMYVEKDVALDKHALRILAHMYIVLTAMTDQPQPEESVPAEENVIIAYMQAVRAAGMRDLAPVYATTIRRGRAIVTMSRMLQDVVQTREQETMLGLLQKHELPLVEILQEQLRWTLVRRFSADSLSDKPVQILEKCEISQLHPGQRIMMDFVDDTLNENDVAIVRSLQFFQLLQGHWQVTFKALADALRGCLVTGRLACAVEIIHNFPFESISMQKSFRELGHSVNIMDKSQAPPEGNTEDAIEWDILRRQAQTYYELDQLVHAIEMLAVWVSNERPFTSAPRQTTSVPTELKQAKLDLDEAMAPLLSGLLLQSDDEMERDYLDKIRITYLPEVIIAYNTALYTAGPTISRDSYIESMDLSVAIADETNGLTECFVAAGRMRELVDGFAQASKMMLVMKANGRPRKPNRSGKDLGLWEIVQQGALAGGAAADMS